MSFQELIEKEREQRRTYILDAAEALFFERGFTRVTMEEIAKNVGLNKATLYLYFEDKDSLFFGIVLRNVRRINEKYEACARMNVSGREKCRLMGQTYFAFAQENPAYFRMLCTAGPERFRDTEHPVAKIVIELLGHQARFLTEALTQGIADGSVRDDLDPVEMSAFISVTTTSIICLDRNWRNALESGGIPYDRFVADYLVFLGNALDKREPEKNPAKERSIKTGKTRKRT
jgi:AcrR family transcriptional regulator